MSGCDGLLLLVCLFFKQGRLNHTQPIPSQATKAIQVHSLGPHNGPPPRRDGSSWARASELPRGRRAVAPWRAKSASRPRCGPGVNRSNMVKPLVGVDQGFYQTGSLAYVERVFAWIKICNSLSSGAEREFKDLLCPRS